MTKLSISLAAILVGLTVICGAGWAALTDAQCDQVRRLQGEYGKELCRKTLENADSGHLQFALASLWLNERVEEGNERLRQAHAGILKGNDKLPASEIMTPEVAGRAKWAMRGWLRAYYMFNDKSSFFPGRLAGDVQKLLEEMFWNYGCYKSTVLRAQLKYIWVIQGSENHDMMDLSNAFLALQAVKDLPAYKSKKLPDGHTAAVHVKAWTEYYKLYCTERAKRGLFVEISPTYGKYFLPELTNIYEFAEDAELRKKMEMLLHLTWADWAIDQLGGVRGGGKTRAYQGHYAQRGTSDSWNFMGRMLIGKGDYFGTKHYEAQYVLALTKYRLADVVIDLALSYDERGDYIYQSMRPSKTAKPPADKPKEIEGYWMDRRDAGHMLRYDYCTPDYIMGSWMLDPKLDYAAINTQNRWQGIIFATDMQARVFPQCVGLGNGKPYNQHLAVQHQNVAIVQKNRKARQSGAMRVFFAPGTKNRVTEKDGSLFLQEGKAYLAITVPAPGPDSSTPPYQWKDKVWLHLADDYAPIVFVAGRVSKYATLNDFIAYIKQHRYEVDKGVLTYRFKDANGQNTQMTMSLDNQDVLPKVNGKVIKLTGRRTFDSPYLHSEPSGAVVTIEKGKRKMVLDFDKTEIRTN